MTEIKQHKILLTEDDADALGTTSCTTCRPRLHRCCIRGTGQPVGPDDLSGLFPMDLIMQEVSGEQYVEIPDEVLDVYRLWRPSPLYRAHRLEKAPGRPRGSTTSTACPGRVPQAQHRGATGVLQRQGRDQEAHDRDRRRPASRTALAFACAQFDLECEVWRCAPVRPEALPADDDRRSAARCTPARPTSRRPGARSWQSTPDSTGSLGIAIGEAVEMAAQDRPRTTPSAACSTTCCCTRRSSARRRCCSRQGR